jgi:hypothetical protein
MPAVQLGSGTRSMCSRRIGRRGPGKLTAMFEDTGFYRKNMVEKQRVIRKKIFGRRLPEEPEKSSPLVVDGQAYNGDAKVVCDTVHMKKIAGNLSSKIL